MNPDLIDLAPKLRGAAYATAGGAMRSEAGELSLAEAKALVAFYQREAAEGPKGWTSVCLARAVELSRAADEAAAWRRAAGWDPPEAADGPKAAQARRPAALGAP